MGDDSYKQSQSLSLSDDDNAVISISASATTSATTSESEMNCLDSITNKREKLSNDEKTRPSPSPLTPMETDLNNEDDLKKHLEKTLPEPEPNSKQKQKQKTPEKAAKKSKKQEESASLALTWICTECREAECATHPDSPLLVCEGPCMRPFHYPCAGLTSLPPDDEEWWCNDCVEKRHPCGSCNQYGTDGVDVFKCDKLNCGMFFHESCLNMYDVDIEIIETRVNGDGDGDGDGDGSYIVTTPKFTCPAHHCWTCSGGMPPRMLDHDDNNINQKERDIPSNKKGKKGKRKRNDMAASFQEKKESLFRCLECPNAYHISCIPPHAKFHELALLCHEHATTCKLPYLDVKESLQGRVETKTDKLIEKITNKKVENVTKKIKYVEGCNTFLFGMKGDRETTYDRQLSQLFASSDNTAINRLGTSNSSDFCVPCTVQKEVHSKPPAYTHVHSNQYNQKHRPKRHAPIPECCQCKPNNDGIICDEHCTNRMMGVECVGNGENKSGSKNPYWNCNHGQGCGNRKLSRRQFAKCKPTREQGKGWGLVTVNGAKQGSLIQEYVGEIIDEKTKRERLEIWAEDHPNDPNFYIMSLETGWYIDAREKGNLSRFINHSCGPNCHLTPVSVGGLTRVAIIAKRDIEPGEFLCYDYQFDTKDSDKFLCRCGAPGCRGTMKGGTNNPGEEDEKKKTKKDVWAEVKAKFDKDKKFLEDVKEDQDIRMNQVSACLPGEDGESARTIASLPSSAFRFPGVCLWRNTLTGSDFASRYLQITAHKKKPTSVATNSLPTIDVLSQMRLNISDCQLDR